MIAFPAGTKVWIAGDVTDMRCGMNTLPSDAHGGYDDLYSADRSPGPVPYLRRSALSPRPQQDAAQDQGPVVADDCCQNRAQDLPAAQGPGSCSGAELDGRGLDGLRRGRRQRTCAA